MSNRYPGSRVEVHGWEARYYDLLIDFISLGKYPSFIKEVISLMEIQPADRIIDFGCGTGRNNLLMLKCLSAQGELVGLDIGEEMIVQFTKRCASYPNAQILKVRMEEPLPFSEEFDKAFMSFVLHGFPHQVREVILTNVQRVLKPQGEFFLLDWNEFSLSEAPFFFRLPFKHLECSQATDFIAHDWRAVLTQQGFENLEEHLFFWQYVRMIRARKVSSGRWK